ncbi:BON1-associated protein 2-like [Senna tora]|uniref:BON1-associated protein 2-like n=1 Tax=Senna tora TaxID=362788 RepID=A0A834XFN5_9FABA|nr:BON1-associated protein 2-like [Senna tora]
MEVSSIAPPPSRTLEVTVSSAENLRFDHRNNNPATTTSFDVYVVVRTESIESFATSMAPATTTTTDSRHSFSWNDKLLVDIPKHARSMTLEVKSKTATGAARSVGVARIAVSDVVGVGDGGELLSYRLRDWEGRPNGVINFSVKVSGRSASGFSTAKSSEVSSCGFQMMRASTTTSYRRRNEAVVTGDEMKPKEKKAKSYRRWEKMETVRRDNTVAHDVPYPRCRRQPQRRRKPHSHRILQVSIIGLSALPLQDASDPICSLRIHTPYSPELGDALEQRLRKVTIECDSKVALELVLNGVDDNYPCSDMVQRVRSLMGRSWDTELVHAFREANRAVDFMAKFSHTLP